MIPQAHIPWLDGGDFFNGIIHPLVTAPHALAITAAAVAAGASGEGEARHLVGGAAVGAVLALMLPLPDAGNAEACVLAGALAAGTAVALGRKMGPRLSAVAGLWTGGWIVLAGRVEAGALVFSAGTAAGLLLAALLLAGAARTIAGGGKRAVVLRIAGSWIAAAALVNLVLGWR